MADKPWFISAKIHGNMSHIAYCWTCENPTTATDITQDKFLDLYAECLLAVIDPHGRYAGRHKELQRR